MARPENAEEAAAMAQAEAAAAAAEEAEWHKAEAARAEYEAKEQQQEAKHTPGPWRAFESTDGYTVDDYIGGIQPAPKVEGNGEAETRANAALIAAAPHLLERATQALHVIQQHEDGLPPADAQRIAYELQGAIGKATYTKEL